MKAVEINLGLYRGTDSDSYTGRPEGEFARQKIGLDALDDDQTHVVVKIPGDTISINPSFFLGLFYKSIKKLKLDHFKNKYEFAVETTDNEAKETLLEDIMDALQYANNIVEKKNGLSSFI